jgi:hypothetical protein
MRENVSELVRMSQKYSGICESILEVGSFRGESAVIFANHFKNVTCVDPWLMGYDDSDAASRCDMSEIENIFDETISKFNNITKIKMKSVDAVKMFEDKSLDMVYIDGCHKYESVREDLLLWIPKIKDGGFISGHDYWYGYTCEVVDAIHNVIGRPEDIYKDSSWVKQVKGNIIKGGSNGKFKPYL